MDKVKKILVLTIVLIALFFFGKFYIDTLQNAKTKATYLGSVLSIVPNNIEATVGETISFDVTLDTNSASVAGILMDLAYDPIAVELLTFTPTQILPVIASPFQSASGSGSITLLSNPESPYNGAGVLGRFTAKILSQKNLSIEFTQATQVASLGKATNDLASSSGIMVDVNASDNQPTIGPTEPPIPSPIPSPILLPHNCTETDCISICKKMGNGCGTQDWIQYRCSDKYDIATCSPKVEASGCDNSDLVCFFIWNMSHLDQK